MKAFANNGRSVAVAERARRIESTRYLYGMSVPMARISAAAYCKTWRRE